MKKIAYFIDSADPGGAETLVIELCKNLGPSEFHPEVLHFGNSWLEGKCQEFNIACVQVPGFNFYKSIKTIPFFSIVFRRFLKQRNIDILHSHLYGSITGTCLAAFLSKIPHIGTIHDTYTIVDKKSRIYLIQVASVLGTRLVTVSEVMQHYLRSLGKFPQGAFITIYNGVNLERYSEPGNNEIRYELELDGNDTILICVGRLVALKRHDILIEAFSRVKSKRPLKLLIVGDGPNRRSVEELIAQKGLENNVRMLGMRHDVPQLLKLSDCFVLSSDSEGLSCSIIEAMAAGLPVVATDVGGNHELINDGKSGYLVAPDDPNALAQTMQLLIDDKKRRKEFGEVSKKIAQEKFSLNEMVDKYVRNYREMNA